MRIIQSLTCLALLLTLIAPARAEIVTAGQPVRLKDVAAVQGARDNQLTGLGLVVGLNGTGDTQSTGITERAIENLVQNYGMFNLQGKVHIKNAAVVSVTAKLPPFFKPGQTIDVTVSSIGDAKSLADGTLLSTPLYAADGKVYAVAQGALSTGGFGVEVNGSAVKKNQTLVARIPNGALVERAVPVTILDASGFLYINLANPDFATASRMAQAIQKSYLGSAQAIDAGTVRVYVTNNYRDNLVDLIARLETLSFLPDTAAKVVMEERTGTIILGSHVRIGAVAVSSGGIVVKVETRQRVSQPEPFSAGTTVVTPESTVSMNENKAKTVVLEGGTTLGQLVKALNALGATPRDLISIVQNIKAAGALNAQLELI